MPDFKIISGGRARLRDMLPLPKPLSLFIEPTNMCNFRCSMCVHGSENTRRDLMPFQNIDMGLYRKIIRELEEWEGPKLKLLRLAILGEPLLNENLPEMIHLAKDANITEKIDIFTNASLLTPELSEKLIDSRLDYVRFSIYSVLDEKHAKITRQTKFTPAIIRENINRLRTIRTQKRQEKPYLFVKMFDTYSDENEKFLEMYEGVVDEIGFEKIHEATKYSGNDLVASYYDKADDIDRTHEAYEKNLHKHIACPRPFMALCVDSLGNVLMCTHDAPRYTKIANLNETSIKEVWFGKELFDFRKMHLEGRKNENLLCANCDWFQLFPEEDNVDGFSLGDNENVQ